jgi:hypothetical protein
MFIKKINIYHCKTTKNYPNLDFFGLKKSGYPAITTWQTQKVLPAKKL